MDGAVGMDADVIEPLAVPLSRLLARGLELSSATFGGLPQRRSAGFATFHMAHLLFAGLLQFSFLLAEVGLRLSSTALFGSRLSLCRHVCLQELVLL